MSEERVREIIRQEISQILSGDLARFESNIEIADFRNITVGKTTGTKIGTEADQKIAFLGQTPRVQYPLLGSPLPNPGATYSQSDAEAVRDRLVGVENILKAFGLEAET